MLTTEDLASTIYTALLRYQKALHKSKRRTEATFPCNGKGKASATDLTRDHAFQIELKAVEFYLPFVDRITTEAQKWAAEPPKDPYEDVLCHYVDDFKLEDDQPYINPISGQLITPVTPFTPGPSGTQGISKDFCELDANTPEEPEIDPLKFDRRNPHVHIPQPASETISRRPASSATAPHVSSLAEASRPISSLISIPKLQDTISHIVQRLIVTNGNDKKDLSDTPLQKNGGLHRADSKSRSGSRKALAESASTSDPNSIRRSHENRYWKVAEAETEYAPADKWQSLIDEQILADRALAKKLVDNVPREPEILERGHSRLGSGILDLNRLEHDISAKRGILEQERNEAAAQKQQAGVEKKERQEWEDIFEKPAINVSVKDARDRARNETEALMLQAEGEAEALQLRQQEALAFEIAKAEKETIRQQERHMVEARRMQKEWEADHVRQLEEQEDYARKLQAELEKQYLLELQEQERLARETAERENRLEWERDIAAAQRLQAQYQAECEAEINQNREQEMIAQGFAKAEQDTIREIERDMATARALQAQWDAEADPASNRHIEQDMATARSLQAQWDTEVESGTNRHIELEPAIPRRQRVHWASEVEDEYSRDIERDMATARRQQTLWDTEVRQNQEQDERRAERRRHEEATKRRQEQAALQAHAVRHRAQKRINRERIRKEKETSRRQQREEERKRSREATCTACQESYDRSRMAILPCNHPYCGDCIRQAFTQAYKNKKPFQCCRRRTPIDAAAKFLPSTLITPYRSLLLELDTPNPVYCGASRCSTFIPPHSIHGNVAVCPTCQTRTCKLCRRPEHAGICKNDKEGAKLLELAGKKHWKPCPQCKTIVERKSLPPVRSRNPRGRAKPVNKCGPVDRRSGTDPIMAHFANTENKQKPSPESTRYLMPEKVALRYWKE